MLVLRPADAEAVSNLAGGDCEKDLKWSLDYSGNLKIRGDGPMDHYGFWDYEAPGWKDYSDQIKTLIGKCLPSPREPLAVPSTT